MINRREIAVIALMVVLIVGCSGTRNASTPQ